MLEEYKEKQPIFYEFVTTSKKHNKISHAYLLETNNVSYANDLALSFAKYLLCGDEDSDISLLIDKGNYPDLKIIDSKKKEIRKEQILSLESEFSLTPICGKYLIYLIKDANLLNKSAANTILKFLEEPNKDVIAILLVNNIQNVISTISSRCQIISLQNREEIDNSIYLKYMDKEDKLEDFKEKSLEKTLAFFKKVENLGCSVLALEDISFYKEDFDICLNIGMKIYNSVLHYKYNIKDNLYEKCFKDIKFIESKNNLSDIIRKIECLSLFLKKANYNVNKELFIYNFVISFVGGVSND